jgi:LacI family transcriptional regulator
VLVDHLLPQGFDQVGVRNKQATQQLVTHLIEHGHRRIGLVSGAPWNSTSTERVAGYKAALSAAGIVYDPSLVRCGESAIDPARRAARELLEVNPRPTAIMAANNLMTIGTMHALRDAKINVPAEMAFVGFDDFDWADRLTVVAQPLQEIGARALNLLIERIKDPEGPRKTIRLAPRLMVRNSCGCP